MNPTQTLHALPQLDPRGQDEPTILYGARVLCYLIEHECTATLTDEDLELADHAAKLGYTAPMDVACYDRIARIQALIRTILRGRARDRAQDAQNPALAPLETTNDPSGGRKVPTHPKPFTQPPSGAYADSPRPAAAAAVLTPTRPLRDDIAF